MAARAMRVNVFGPVGVAGREWVDTSLGRDKAARGVAAGVARSLDSAAVAALECMSRLRSP